MTSGARTIFMLPKITEEQSHNRLKNYFNVQEDQPNSLFEHWKVFKEIANSPCIDSQWGAEIICFSKKWFEHVNDKKWMNFYYYMMKNAWKSSEFWRNQYIWDITFNRIHAKRGIKPSRYVVDMVKHILAVGVRALPGFAPALDNSAAPVSLLQKAYLDIYGLKNYAPIIFQPHYFSMAKKGRAVYTSLNLPTAIELAQKDNERTSTVVDLYNIQSLLKKYFLEINNGKLNINTTPLSEMPKSVDFNFFHSDIGKYHEINDTRNLLDFDLAFSSAVEFSENKAFPTNGNFVRGCIQVVNKISADK